MPSNCPSTPIGTFFPAESSISNSTVSLPPASLPTKTHTYHPLPLTNQPVVSPLTSLAAFRSLLISWYSGSSSAATLSQKWFSVDLGMSTP